MSFSGLPLVPQRRNSFEDTFPWSRSVKIRESILRKNILPKGNEYVRSRYLDTVNSTDKLDTDSKLEAQNERNVHA